MRLSSKFVLLFFGSVIIPALLVGFLILLREFGGPSGQIPPYEYLRLQRAINKLEQQEIEPEGIPAFLKEASPLAEALVIDDRDRVLYSSTRVKSLREFLAVAKEEYRYNYIQVNVTAPDGKGNFVLVAYPVEREDIAHRGYLMLIIPLSVLLFTTFMSVFIIRSINGSISRLEEATRSIINGNLDFKLEVKGKDRIASLSRSFDTMRERVREESAARSRFIMAISHDLKTPLSSITGYLDAIQDGMASNREDLDKYLSIIRDKTGLLEGRIRWLIDFVKLETSEWKRSLEKVRLAPFLQEAGAIFGVEAEARGFQFLSRIETDGSLELMMDESLFLRAIENLVQNAFRHATPESLFAFEAVQNDENIEISVRNSGEDISDEDMPYIFEPFYRGTKTRRETGFGLGLASVKSIVSSHGWKIQVYSQDRTTVFTVQIPIRSDPA